MKKDIHIRKDGTADDCVLDSSNWDEATWLNDGATDRLVVFGPGRSPFAQEKYVVHPGIPQPSGRITTTQKGEFPYDLKEAAADAPAADPHIIIK